MPEKNCKRLIGRATHQFVKSLQALLRANSQARHQCSRETLTCVTLGFGGPNVAQTPRPSRIVTAASRTENLLTPYPKIDFRDNAAILVADYAEFMNKCLGLNLLLSYRQRSLRM